ncbi:MAG: TPM domain-containing protein [Bacteroidales bacterium]|nr:TPM domain-containing protein [Bacteroidales bacterium]
MKHRLLIVLLLLTVWPLRAEWLPERTNRLVNDYSQILTESQRNTLEKRLVAFNDSTSNQILVIITPTLEGDDENAVAQRIGQAWGVGQKEFSNGVVILIKSKTPDENWGAVAISTGYGVEGALPDVFCKRIIDDHMLDALGNGDYYRALTKALDIIEPVLAGEYSYAQYRKDERREGFIALGVFALFIIFVIVVVGVYAKKHPESWHDNGGKGGGIYFGGFGGGGSNHGGGFGGFGGGGGFGGFGGGSFGGGGASGRF